MHCRTGLKVGIWATVVLLLLSQLIEHTAAGLLLERQAYVQLLRGMSNFTGDHLPVVVFDIHRLKGGKDGPTDRVALEHLIDAISDAQPLAVALDIDFSPDARGWKTPHDPAFFQFCLDTMDQRQRPIILGVYRTRYEAPKPWLGIPQFQSLAAAGLARRDDPIRAVRWIVTSDSSIRLPTMGQALAAAYHGEPPNPDRVMKYLLEETQTRPDVLVNYSKLDQMRVDTINWTPGSPVKSEAKRLENKLVILGDAEEATDNFVIPGQSLPVPGVFVMASTAYTFAFEPLYEFSRLSRVMIDLLISALVLGGLYYICRSQPRHAAKTHATLFLFAVILIVFGGGTFLARHLSVMWLDFLLIPLTLFLHPNVHELITNWLRAIRHARHEITAPK